MTHANIIPLNGGLALGQKQAFGQEPKYNLSWSDFAANDFWTRQNFPGAEFYLIDKNQHLGGSDLSVDVIGSVCPCAGLSNLSASSSSENPVNDWMYRSARVVLEHVKPIVYWGENAPALATNKGKGVRLLMAQIAQEHSYSFSLLKTKSIYHGLPQVRERSFYFFWKGDRVPQFTLKAKPLVDIESYLDTAPKDPAGPVNKNTPSQHPYYRFLLERWNLTHWEFTRQLDKTMYVLTDILYSGVGPELLAWLKENSTEREVARMERILTKINSGGRIRDQHIIIPKGTVGAFVGQVPLSLVHPREDRYLTLSEMKWLMGLPEDYIFDPGSKNECLNHLCQSVPVSTARDVAEQVKFFVEGKLKTFQVSPGEINIQEVKLKKVIEEPSSGE